MRSATQRPGESCLSLVERNAKMIMGMVVPKVLKKSLGAAIYIVSDPCDIMSRSSSGHGLCRSM